MFYMVTFSDGKGFTHVISYEKSMGWKNVEDEIYLLYGASTLILDVEVVDEVY